MIEVECSHGHNYCADCLKEMLQANEAKGRVNDFECKGCGEIVKIVTDIAANASLLETPYEGPVVMTPVDQESTAVE